MLIDIASFVGGLAQMIFGLCFVLWVLYEIKMSPVDREIRKNRRASRKRTDARKTTRRQQNTYIAKLIYFFYIQTQLLFVLQGN